ncbi:MAG: 50S ribosomal protein L11 methyltransferase [Deltaproteobacteria bacterium]|nr:50S ribosomal protein L11 methyltransferase [Deltaproteobacteria bacterium]
MTYSLAAYGQMLADHVRMEAYHEALRRTVWPGCVVVDLGAGQGIMSFIALQLGARLVHAIDPSPILELARLIARDNGFADRIQFHSQVSTEVTLSERADVVVADLRGRLPAFDGNFRSMADARKRLLKPMGTLIPQRDRLRLALAEAPDRYEEIIGRWTYPGLDLRAAHRSIVNDMTNQAVTASQLLTESAQWAVVDYLTIGAGALAGTARLTANRTGVAHGLSLWFEAELVDGVGFSTGPSHPKTICGHPFLPLIAPVPVRHGDVADIELRADPVGDDYVWSWNTRVVSPDGTVGADFRQSTFFAAPLSAGLLRRRADTHRPRLGHQGTVDRAILDRFSGGRTLREIAAEIAEHFPDDFADWQSAFERVASLSAKYDE